jgi:hypothetical protein
MALKKVWALGIGGFLMGLALAVPAQPVGHEHHDMHQHPANPVNDGREMVLFPEEMRRQTLANMRDHLLALQQIQEALGQEKFDAAADVAEERLGMTSLRLHGAHEVGRYMPPGMQEIGGNMHRAASQLAVAAKNASVTGDVKPALVAYSRVMQQCVACHSSYRVQ